jgi:hypothetical protein
MLVKRSKIYSIGLLRGGPEQSNRIQGLMPGQGNSAHAVERDGRVNSDECIGEPLLDQQAQALQKTSTRLAKLPLALRHVTQTALIAGMAE